ncbi:MAG: hypothetical protein ACJAS1_005034, partial [Oleiphilaceae bacterium]
MEQLKLTKTKDKAKRVIEALKNNVPVQQIKNNEAKDDEDWFRISKKASDLYLTAMRQKRKEDEAKHHVGCTSVSEIKGILELNDKLAYYALSIPSIATMHEVSQVKCLMLDMPNNEHKVIGNLEQSTMSPRSRALQKKGR